ncbi:MAG: peptidoglycan DD-metalloendopeptidase family protein [Lachnospiraceae bacterium]|nr:peptidoglycan DD-metalloendopeptidase family protein [Lachnospiraceae bacterium]
MKFSRKHNIIIAALLAAGLIASASQVPAKAATSMSSITSDSIKEKESQIADLQKDRTKMKNSLTDLQKVKKDLETQKANLKNYVAKLDAQLVDIEKNISNLNVQITAKEAEIEATLEELDKATAIEEEQQRSMISRIRMMYEVRDTQWADVLLSSGDFSKFLNSADSIEKVAAYDKQMYEAFKATREYVALCEQQLQIEKEYLDETKRGVEAEQANMEALIAQKNKDIENYETDINTKQQAIKEYEQMIREQDGEIAALEAAIAAEKKAILAASGTVLTYDGGQFKFPLATYTRVSDDYGMRMHPTLGVQQFHNGVDFASPKGTAIYAAYDGKVIAATYSSTMGNYIMIDHGDELYTIYMHASALYVKSGDIVSRGDTIAAVGSTGRSTGNHLHFSVRKNGSYVSPWNYLKQ